MSLWDPIIYFFGHVSCSIHIKCPYQSFHFHSFYYISSPSILISSFNIFSVINRFVLLI
jgi:hypothetical protein